MSLYGVTFANQPVAAVDDAIPWRRLLTDGVLQGMALSFSGSTVTIGAGMVIACGRIVGNDAPVSLTVSAASGYARVTLVLDLTGAATETAFSQAQFRVDTASTVEALPALVQQDINDGTSTTYEAALAILALSASGVESVYSSLGPSVVNLAQGNVTPQALAASVNYAAIGLAANQVRPIKMGTEIPTAETLAEGEIYLQYS